jgi:hypothetical protein
MCAAKEFSNALSIRSRKPQKEQPLPNRLVYSYEGVASKAAIFLDCELEVGTQ